MTRRLAKWFCIRLGNLAVRLAPVAGIDLVFRVGSRRPVDVPQRPVAVPMYFRATCKDCGCDSFEFEGTKGPEVLAFHCLICQGRRWSVAPSPEHQGSKKV